MNINSVPVLFNIIKSCHDGTRLYPSGNPILDRQIKSFIDQFDQFAKDEHISLAIWLDELSVNGQPLPQSFRQLPAVAWFVTQCDERHIHRIDFEKGLDEKGLKALIALLGKDAREFVDAPTTAALLSGIAHVTVNADSPAPASQPVPAPGPSEPAPLAEPTPEAPPIAVAIPVVHESAPLLIGHQDSRVLFDTMVGYIANQNLKKVADTLTVIRGDLAASDRVEREVAYSSYHVVIRSLINANQGHSLHSIIPSFAADLNQCREADLYRVHLDTMVAMITYFYESGMMAPFLYAVDILANQNMRQSDEVQHMLGEKLSLLLETAHLENIFLDDRIELQPLKKSLFDTHAAGIYQPLLAALYHSENRLVRKKLLESLQKPGSLLYPAFLEELRQAIDKEQPWFIKRNLLTLLAIKPPIELAPILRVLHEEGNPRLKDLIARCLFQIPDRHAFELGKKILTGAEEPASRKLLGYVMTSRQSIYAPEVMAIYKRTENDRTRREAIAILARMDSEESITFLGEILAQTTGFGKTRDRHRMQAARALIASTSPAALSVLLKHRRDPEREIRDLIKLALSRVS